MSVQIRNLKKRIEAIKKMSITKVGCKCDECGYYAHSQPFFKLHITTKHPSTKPPENLRDSVLSSYLLVLKKEQKIFWCLKMNSPCKKWQNVNTGIASLTAKLQMKWHNISMWSMQLMTHLCTPILVKKLIVQNVVFLAVHNYAMQAYKEHFPSFNCTQCHKHFHGDNLMYCIHMKMCPASCDGNPRCPFKYLTWNIVMAGHLKTS